MTTPPTSHRGFTLVEIMIVVAIIGMLAALAIPNFVHSREQAHKVGCISNLRQIDGAVQMWAVETQRDEQEKVSYADIRKYLRNLVVCPAGGTTFEDSYQLTTVDQRPTCRRRPGVHVLPE